MTVALPAPGIATPGGISGGPCSGGGWTCGLGNGGGPSGMPGGGR